MSDREDIMELRYTGATVRPDTVRAGELARLISATEESVLSVIEEELLDQDAVELHFVSLETGSVGLQFTSRKASAYQAFDRIAETVVQANYDRLASKAVSGLRVMHNFSKQHNSPLEFYSLRKSSEPIAVLAPAAVIQLTPRISGATTLYGEVIRVGGKRPRVRVRMLNGAELSCVTSKPIAQQLGQRLYHTVGLQGTAQWETDTFSIVQFEVTDILDYDDSPDDPIAQLSREFGHYFDDITDVDAYVRSLRDGDE